MPDNPEGFSGLSEQEIENLKKFKAQHEENPGELDGLETKEIEQAKFQRWKALQEGDLANRRIKPDKDSARTLHETNVNNISAEKLDTDEIFKKGWEIIERGKGFNDKEKQILIRFVQELRSNLHGQLAGDTSCIRATEFDTNGTEVVIKKKSVPLDNGTWIDIRTYIGGEKDGLVTISNNARGEADGTHARFYDFHKNGYVDYADQSYKTMITTRTGFNISKMGFKSKIGNSRNRAVNILGQALKVINSAKNYKLIQPVGNPN